MSNRSSSFLSASVAGLASEALRRKTYNLHLVFGILASGGSENFSVIPSRAFPVWLSLARAPDNAKFAFILFGLSAGSSSFLLLSLTSPGFPHRSGFVSPSSRSFHLRRRRLLPPAPLSSFSSSSTIRLSPLRL